MSAIIPQVLPPSRIAISIRPATTQDLPFIDQLQKMHTKQVGWMPTKQLEGKIGLGHVLVAKDESGQRVGYCIGNDQYFKRDDVGIIYQLNVVPGNQRKLVGATLLRAQFERSAYGCRLYCCWCAQDIEANRFWESMGFVPLAFRAGSREKGRVHIFWQRRIRAGDSTTPYWFPAKTSSGSIREDRLVLPIPPGTHWSDAKPLILPGILPGDQKQIEEKAPVKRIAGPKQPRVAGPKYALSSSKLHFVAPKPARGSKERLPREKRKTVKNDPKYVAAARELRDRWLEKVNEEPALLTSQGKYEVGRQITSQTPTAALKALPAAA